MNSLTLAGWASGDESSLGPRGIEGPRSHTSGGDAALHPASYAVCHPRGSHLGAMSVGSKMGDSSWPGGKSSPG